MVNPVKLSRDRYKNIEQTNPKKAEKIKSRSSGEIFGLRNTPEAYTTDEIIEAIFEEGEFISVD